MMYPYFKKLWFLFSKEDKYYLLVIFFSILIIMILEIVSVSLFYPLIQILFNKESENLFFSFLGKFSSSDKYFSIILLLIFCIFFIKNLFIIFFLWLKNVISNQIYYNLASNLNKKYLFSPYLFHTENNSSILIRNITNEIPVVHSAVINIIMLMSEIFVVFGLLVFLLYINPLTSFVIFLLVAFISVLYNYIFTDYSIRLGDRKVYHSGQFLKHLMQGLGGIKIVKILGKESFFSSKFNTHIYRYMKINTIHRTVAEISRNFLEIFVILFFVCVFYFSIILIKVDINTLLPTIGVFAVAAFRVLPSSSRILSSYNFLNFSLKSIQVIYDEFRNNTSSADIESFDKSKNIQFEYFDKKPGFLKITELNYTYPKAKKQIINNLSISAKTGEIIGIMGKSGTGKTTLVDLILGILTPNNGEIKYNDVNVFKNLKHWQKLFGYVPQDIYLIDDSIKNNIAYGIEEKKINIKKIYKILESLDLTDFVNNLENSINTTVGERGVKISGGELQRIGIARALYNDPQILILDESTSSLDTLTERKILEIIHTIKSDLLIFIVSHKLSTTEICDKVYKLENGKLNFINK